MREGLSPRQSGKRRRKPENANHSAPGVQFPEMAGFTGPGPLRYGSQLSQGTERHEQFPAGVTDLLLNSKTGEDEQYQPTEKFDKAGKAGKTSTIFKCSHEGLMGPRSRL